MLVNYCVKQVNNNDFSYLPILLSLYQHALENDYILENGILSRFTFMNIVKIAIKCGELDWVMEFIENHKIHIEKSYRESVYHFCLASLAYAQKDYDKSLIYLQKYSSKNAVINLAAKTLQMKIFYEKRAYELLESHLKAMELFVRRKEVLGYHKENYSNIIKFTKQLHTVNNFDRNALQKLKEKIEKISILTEKEWLVYQIEMLI